MNDSIKKTLIAACAAVLLFTAGMVAYRSLGGGGAGISESVPVMETTLPGEHSPESAAAAAPTGQ